MPQYVRPTVRDLIRYGRDRLLRAGVETATLDTELLLAHARRETRSQLVANLQERVPLETAEDFESLLLRRLAREPVAYIVGRREFWGRSFVVDQSVLVPRPETELLVERAVEISPPGGVVADIGTGSGCIAVSVALDRPDLVVYATDRSPEALAVARSNAAELGAEGRIRFLEGSLLAPLPDRVDVIVANLPYVPTQELAVVEPEVSSWEPRLALDGGPDGLDLVRHLIADLPAHVTQPASCFLEIDPRQYEAVTEMVRTVLRGWSVKPLQDLSGRTRVAELSFFTGSLHR